MRFVFTNDLDEFAGRTRALFESRIECNIHATVTGQLVAGRHAAAQAVLAYGVDDAGEVCFGAMRTPPWPMLASELAPEAAPTLVELWLAADPEVPGVSALPDTARAIAAAWSELTGRHARCNMREAMHVLDRVNDPDRPARGELRAAGVGDRDLLIEWMRAFSDETGVLGGDQAEQIVDAQLPTGQLFVWDDAGAVSMVGVRAVVSGVARIGPVYTPPELRRRGYATSMVAEASRRALAAGAERCMLYTDLANPTSNKIYAEVGYRRVGDWEDHAFERAAPD